MNDLEARLQRTVDGPPPDRLARLRRRLADAAAADGLLDVAFASTDSPIGRLTLAATPAGLVRLAFDTEARDAVLEELAARLSPRVLEAPARLDTARRELEEYFAGRRDRFDLRLDWSLTRGFHRAVLDATARIPYGRTETYRSVAAAAGSPAAVRAAGTALARNPIPIVVPCHRVLRTDGGMGGYRGGLERKDALLRLEAAGAGAGA
ncbi:MAG TPA: methylated-DNA--[protein]-cysteine S-methyltransferase, partial [Solirubrobacteraceae bacterium]|nr:methylated-DNA--[protein]-cysteine S-methyltransferase [Solirubrobacteraceae bacterium]